MENNNRLLLMSPSPHIKSDESTRWIMIDIIVALAFPLIMAVYFFGWRSLSLTAISVAASVAAEALYCKLTKKTASLGDLTAVVTGMLFAMCLPVSAPLWLPVVGAVLSVVVIKHIFGGIGKYFLNPVLAAKAMLMAWPITSSPWIKPSLGANSLGAFQRISADVLTSDIVVSVTPLSKMKMGFLPSVAMNGPDMVYELRDVAIGNVAGCIGEVSALVIIAAALYLVVRKVITFHIPLAYIGTVALLTYIFPLGDNPPFMWMMFSLCSGGLLFGAVFLATDYATSPPLAKGRIIYGIGCGIITVLIRYFGAYEEGVVYAILIMNCFTCLIEQVIKPRRYGVLKTKKAGGRNE